MKQQMKSQMIHVVNCSPRSTKNDYDSAPVSELVPAKTPTTNPAAAKYWATVPFICGPSDPIARASRQYFAMEDREVVGRVVAGDDNAAYYLLFGRYSKAVEGTANRNCLSREELVGPIFIHFRTKDGRGWDPDKFVKDNFCAYYVSVLKGLALTELHEKYGMHSIQDEEGRKKWVRTESPISCFLSDDGDEDGREDDFVSRTSYSQKYSILERADFVEGLSRKIRQEEVLGDMEDFKRLVVTYRHLYGMTTKETVALLKQDMAAGRIPARPVSVAIVDNTYSRLRRSRPELAQL